MPPRKKTTKGGKQKKIETIKEEEKTEEVNNETQLTSGANSISVASSFKSRGRPRRSIPRPKNNGAVFGHVESTTRQQNAKKSCANNSPMTNKLVSSPLNQQQITQYFPIRRSSRKVEAEMKKEDDEELEKMIESKMQDGLEIKEFEGKGRGIVATRMFQRKEFVIEYAGELVDVPEAKEREVDYLVGQKGCYMYYFNHKNKNYCVDATAESEYYGRLVNHSRRKPNCAVKIVEVKGKPHLVLVALRDIRVGEEILYDYGDRSKESLTAHPWLAF